MQGTDHFKRTIQMYLEQRAEEDALFAKNYRNPAKHIDDCVTYILNYVKKSGCNGFTDGEIFGQAVTYYDENEIEAVSYTHLIRNVRYRRPYRLGQPTYYCISCLYRTFLSLATCPGRCV